jgi:UDP-2-acetamido-2,6-beta-L-arabino-hexul-4-ose reductase
LYQYLLLKNNIELVSFENEFFKDFDKLCDFVSSCETIVHLAAVNRHDDPKQLYDINVKLTHDLIAACESKGVSPHIIFSSSTQEHLNNNYGNAKKEARISLEKWAKKNDAITTGLIIPNVFGPFGKPNYNSFIATFCYKIARGESPTVINDSVVKLIYVNELLARIYDVICNRVHGKVEVAHSYEVKVTEVLEKLNSFHKIYFENHSFPDLSLPFDLALFNTYLTYLPSEIYPRFFKNNIDHRGNFVEIARTNSKGQFSFSTTMPGITRGNHFHTRKAERFAVIKGKALIKIRRIGSEHVLEYKLDGSVPSYVDMPIWHTHNITNIGDDELLTLFWINEAFDPSDPDTYFVGV